MTQRFSQFTAIIVIAFGLGLVACQPKPSLSAADDLYSYKTDYVGDNSKVAAIVRSQVYPQAIKIDGIEILSKAPPYGLTVLIDTDKVIQPADLQKNTNVTFALIKNLDSISYLHKNSRQIVAQYQRGESEKQLEQQMGKTYTQLASSADDLAVYLDSQP